MADLQSSLSIRSESDGTDARVHVKIRDSATPDGSGNAASVTDSAVHVKVFGLDPTSAAIVLKLAEDGTPNSSGVYGATNTNASSNGLIGHVRAASPAITDQTIRTTAADLTTDGIVAANVHALDTSAFLMAYNGTTFDRVTSTAGSLNVNITDAITVHLNGLYNVSTNPTPDSVGNIFHTRAATPDATNQTFRSTGAQANADGVTAANVYGIDTNSFNMGYNGATWDRISSFANKLGVALFDQTGSAYTIANPMPVFIADSSASTEVNSFDLASAVASGATAVHTYTVTAGKTFKFAQVMAAASGKIKVVISVETGVSTGLYTTLATVFNSTSQPNIMLDIKELVTVAAGVRIRCQKTNLELLAQDCYDTLSGYEF